MSEFTVDTLRLIYDELSQTKSAIASQTLLFTEQNLIFTRIADTFDEYVRRIAAQEPPARPIVIENESSTEEDEKEDRKRQRESSEESSDDDDDIDIFDDDDNNTGGKIYDSESTCSGEYDSDEDDNDSDIPPQNAFSVLFGLEHFTNMVQTRDFTLLHNDIIKGIMGGWGNGGSVSTRDHHIMLFDALCRNEIRVVRNDDDSVLRPSQKCGTCNNVPPSSNATDYMISAPSHPTLHHRVLTNGCAERLMSMVDFFEVLNDVLESVPTSPEEWQESYEKLNMALTEAQIVNGTGRG